MFTYIHSICTHIHSIHTYIHTNIHKLCIHTYIQIQKYTRMYVCICMYMYVHMCMRVCMYVCIYVRSPIHVLGEMSYSKREGELSGGNCHSPTLFRHRSYTHLRYEHLVLLCLLFISIVVYIFI